MRASTARRGVRVPYPRRRVEQQHAVLHLLEHEVPGVQLARQPLVLEPDRHRAPDMRRHRREMTDVRLLEIAAPLVSERDRNRTSAAADQRRCRHYAVETLRSEPFCVERRADEFRLGNHHLIGQRPAEPTDRLPDPVPWGQACIGFMQGRIDAGLRDSPEFVRLHVLDAEPGARRVHRVRDHLERIAPGEVVCNALVNTSDQSLVAGPLRHAGSQRRPPG
ncbi:MAG: hypothetical protein JO047_17030 [Alphaproteobacteria bacterium]|nr:hypothetical protein [Alphaproteobacteria bacterium]